MRQNAERGPLVRVGDHRDQQAVFGRLDLVLTELGRARERITKIPTVDRKIIENVGIVGDNGSGPMFPPAFGLSKVVPRPEVREWQFVPVQLFAKLLLQVPYEELQIQRQAAETEVSRKPEVVNPPHFP